MGTSVKTTDETQGYLKAEAWCAYQERCQQEVRTKLYEWGLSGDTVEAIIAKLISGNFINEERFARTYAGGKFRIKKWGKVKIRIELKKRKITDYCIRKGLAEISDRDYLKTMSELADKRMKGKRSKLEVQKTGRYLIGKGYEPDLVWDLLIKH